MRRRHTTSALVMGLLATAGITAVALAVAAGLSVGNKPEARKSPVTLENFGRIIPGMTKPEVVAILGADYEAQVDVHSPILGNPESYVWENAQGGRIVLGFSRGEVVTRIQSGLKRGAR